MKIDISNIYGIGCSTIWKSHDIYNPVLFDLILVLYDRKKNKKEESESYSAKAALDRTP